MNRTSRVAWLGALLVVGLGCAGVLGTPAEQMEASYQSNLQTLHDLETKLADPTQKDALHHEIDLCEADHDDLPQDAAAAEDALGNLNQRMRADIEQYQPIVDAAANVEGEAIRPLLVGDWSGGTIVLNIDAGGQVHYENNAPNFQRTLDVPLAEVHGDSFSIGVFGITTEFHLDAPPTQLPDGSWTMTVDGTVLTRAATAGGAPAAPPMGAAPVDVALHGVVDGECKVTVQVSADKVEQVDFHVQTLDASGTVTGEGDEIWQNIVTSVQHPIENGHGYEAGLYVPEGGAQCTVAVVRVHFSDGTVWSH